MIQTGDVRGGLDRGLAGACHRGAPDGVTRNIDLLLAIAQFNRPGASGGPEIGVAPGASSIGSLGGHLGESPGDGVPGVRLLADRIEQGLLSGRRVVALRREWRTTCGWRGAMVLCSRARDSCCGGN